MSRLAGEITYSKLLRFAVPLVISHLFMDINFIVDGIFVANAVGSTGLAAVNIDMPIIFLALSLAIMLGTGGSAFVAKELGEGKRERARENFSLLVLTGFIASALLGFLGIFFSGSLLTFLGANEELYALCYDYALPLFISLPFTMLGIMLDMFLVVEGRPRLAMLSSIIGGLINIGLDYLLLFVFEVGLIGAGTATGIGYSISAFVGFGYFALARGGTLRFVMPKARFSVLMKSVTNGMSEMVSLLSMGVITIVLNNTMMRLVGADGVAAISVMEYIMALLGAIYIGYAEGAAPLTSFNFGRRDGKALQNIISSSARIIVTFAIGTIVIGLMVAEPLISAFAAKDSAVHELALRGFHIYIAGFFFAGFNIYISSFFTALGEGVTSATIAFGQTIVFSLGLLLLLPEFFGVDGVFAAKPLADFLGAVLACSLLYYKRKLFLSLV